MLEQVNKFGKIKTVFFRSNRTALKHRAYPILKIRARPGACPATTTNFHSFVAFCLTCSRIKSA